MTLKTDLDRADLNTVADGLRLAKLGQMLGGELKQVRRKVNMDALGRDPSDLATLDSYVVQDAPALTVLRAYARAGSAGTGEMTVVAVNVTPTAGEIAVSPSGSIVTLAADALTDVDIEYMAMRGEVVEITGAPATGVLAIPAQYTARGVLYLLEAEALAGAVTGRKIVVAPAAGLPATTQARLDVAKANVSFNNATDAVTSARAKLFVAYEDELIDTLESDANLV